MLLDSVSCAISRYRMFARGQRVAVAVSGGADSVCLLYALVELAHRWDLRLEVAHVNHVLRGEESRQDAEFVRAVASSYGTNSIWELESVCSTTRRASSMIGTSVDEPML